MVTRSSRLGYALNQEDIIPGIAAIGIAVGPAAAQPAAALSIAAAAADLHEFRRLQRLEQLLRGGSELQKSLAESRYFAME